MLKEGGFWQGFTSERSVRLAMAGSRVGMVFGGAFLIACLGSYPTYNALETDGAGNGLACRLASVAYHDYRWAVLWLFLGTLCSLFSFIISVNKEKDLYKNLYYISYRDVIFIYPPLLLVCIFYVGATSVMLQFLTQSSQPALVAMKQPLDGYICPPSESNKSH